MGVLIGSIVGGALFLALLGTIVGWMFDFVILAVKWLTQDTFAWGYPESLTNSVTVDQSMFKFLPNSAGVLQFFQILGIIIMGICLINSILKLMMAQTTKVTNQTPIMVIIRAIFTVAAFILFPVVYNALFKNGMDFVSRVSVLSGVKIPTSFDLKTSFWDDGNYIIAIVLGFTLMSSCIQAVITHLERYFSFVIYMALSPIAIGFYADADTADITKRWFKGIFSQIAGIVLSTWLLNMALLEISKGSQGSGDILLYVYAVVFLQAAAQSEKFMNAMGLQSVANGSTAQAISKGMSTAKGAAKEAAHLGSSIGRLAAGGVSKTGGVDGEKGIVGFLNGQKSDYYAHDKGREEFLKDGEFIEKHGVKGMNSVQSRDVNSVLGFDKDIQKATSNASGGTASYITERKDSSGNVHRYRVDTKGGAIAKEMENGQTAVLQTLTPYAVTEINSDGSMGETHSLINETRGSEFIDIANQEPVGEINSVSAKGEETATDMTVSNNEFATSDMGLNIKVVNFAKGSDSEKAQASRDFVERNSPSDKPIHSQYEKRLEKPKPKDGKNKK